ncbi:unnamed protein product [Rotaria sp. Silwood2]|nr:unnamed protein product [Rotaria sp. Silwood2]CAF4167823.1 unnamed protein product [Rotaria sp. Silwood2]
MQTISLYQRDIFIEKLDSKSGDYFEVKGRPCCALIMQLFIHEHQFDRNIFVRCDKKDRLYSTSNLLTPQSRTNEDGLIK